MASNETEISLCRVKQVRIWKGAVGIHWTLNPVPLNLHQKLKQLTVSPEVTSPEFETGDCKCTCTTTLAVLRLHCFVSLKIELEKNLRVRSFVLYSNWKAYPLSKNCG